jgi:hypothetical protein
MGHGTLLEELERHRYRRPKGQSPYRSNIGKGKRRTAYFYRATPLSLKKKGSAIGAAAYRSREALRGPDGKLIDWREKGADSPVLYSKITLPENASERFLDRQTLWEEAQAAERQSNARYGRDFTVVIPPELQDDAGIKMLVDEHSKYLASFGYAVDANVHAPGPDTDARNVHVHFMITDRPIQGDHFARVKNDKEWRRQSHPAFLEKARETFAVSVNRELENRKLSVRVDHRSNLIQFEEAISNQDWELARELAEPGRPHLPRKILEDAKRGKAEALATIAEIEAENAATYKARMEFIATHEKTVNQLAEYDQQIDQAVLKSQTQTAHLDQLSAVTASLLDAANDPSALRRIADAAHEQFVQPEIVKHLPALTAPLREKLVDEQEHEKALRTESELLKDKLDKLNKRGSIGRTFSIYDTENEIKITEQKYWRLQKTIEQSERNQDSLEKQIGAVHVDPEVLSLHARHFQVVISTAREQAREVERDQEQRQTRARGREPQRGKGLGIGE